MLGLREARAKLVSGIAALDKLIKLGDAYVGIEVYALALLVM